MPHDEAMSLPSQSKNYQNILTNKFIYDDTFRAFKNGTEQKREITARLNQAFIKTLQSALVFKKDTPLKIADIACGPGDTIIKYLENINFPEGFDIRATDKSVEYAGHQTQNDNPEESTLLELGQAYNNLLLAKLSQIIPLKDFTVKRGDAFDGNLNCLLSKSGVCAEPNTFKIAILSHCMYHIKSDEKGTWNEKVDKILDDVANNLLELEGVGILHHVSYSPQTLQYFRAKYGHHSDQSSQSDTDEMDNTDPPSSITESCEKQRIPCYTFEFPTSLYFSNKIKDHLEMFKNPAIYSSLHTMPDALEDYYKLSFIVQRATDEMAFDKSNTGLNSYIDDVKKCIRRSKSGLWYMSVVDKMQVIVNPKSSKEFQQKINEAFQQTASQLPEITQQVPEDFEPSYCTQKIL